MSSAKFGEKKKTMFANTPKHSMKSDLSGSISRSRRRSLESPSKMSRAEVRRTVLKTEKDAMKEKNRAGFSADSNIGVGLDSIK